MLTDKELEIFNLFKQVGIVINTKEAKALSKVRKTYIKSLINKFNKRFPQEVPISKKVANMLWSIWKRSPIGDIESSRTYYLPFKGSELYACCNLARRIYNARQDLNTDNVNDGRWPRKNNSK